MSNFKDLFKEKCFVVEQYTRPIGCPTCIPDLSEPLIDWLQTDEPYFDPRTCEYVVNYLAPHIVGDLSDLGDTLTSYVDWVKVYGARKIFEHFVKQIPATYPSSIDNLNWTSEEFTSVGGIYFTNNISKEEKEKIRADREARSNFDIGAFYESGDYYYIQTSPETVLVQNYSFIRTPCVFE